MANDSTGFFYWYRRYKVRAQDMTDFQEAMVETARGVAEGIAGAAVLRGFQVVPAGGKVLAVSGGIATAASGYLEVMNTGVMLDATAAASGALPCRSLVVCTPSLVDSDAINSPTSPFNQVPLRQLQKATVILIPGTPAQNPSYPAKGPNDVVLCGLNIPPGITNIDPSMIDFEARDSLGANSLFAQNQVRFDDRLRPFRSSAKILGIKPSQNVGSGPLGFSYPGRLTPSLFPLNAGSFNPQDTFVDMSTGQIMGGDTTSPPFSPVVPPGNFSVVCLVTLTQDDTLNFNFGTVGGYAQCLSSIRNQVYQGPGSLAAQDGNFPVAYVIVSSHGGAISDIQVMDARAFLGSGTAAAKFIHEAPSGAVNGSNNVFNLSKTPSDPASLLFFVDTNVLEATDFSLNGTTVTVTNPDFTPQSGQTVYARYLVYGAVTNSGGGAATGAKFFDEAPIGVVDGMNGTFFLTNFPVDADSLFFWVDSNVLTPQDFTLSQNQVTITNPDFIPDPGQKVYAKYLYLGVIPGGGGGGGSSRRTTKAVTGSFTVPPIDGDYVLIMNTSTGAATAILPPVTPSEGLEVGIKNPGSVVNPITVVGVSGQLIDGQSFDTIDTPNEAHNYRAVSGAWYNF